MLERGTFLQILFNPTKNQFKTTNDYEHYLVKNVNKLYSTQSYCPDSNDVSENNLQSPERAFNSHVDFIYAPQLKMSQPGELEFPKEQTFSQKRNQSPLQHVRQYYSSKNNKKNALHKQNFYLQHGLA